jgi:putative ABC transport system permease protein
MVRRESLIISLQAIPLGVLAGILITFVCSGILKIYNPHLFGDISIFNFSAIGIGAGVLTGFLTVFIASMLPAQKAAKVSPVNAVTGSAEIKISIRQKRGFLTRVFPVEIAMGVNSAMNKKRTLILMTSSIAISIILFLGFSVLVNPAFMGMKTDKPYTEDLTLTSDQAMTPELLKKLSQLEGTEILGNPTEHMIDLQLRDKNDEQTVSEVRGMIDETITLHDKRQMNTEANNAFMTIAVFIYGFVAVIAVISMLNLINTMNTSVVSRAKYLAILRAVGMSDKQLNKMVLAQAITYCLTGCIIGCTFGVLLQKKLLDFLAADWSFPLIQVVGISVICIITGGLSVIGPLKKMKKAGISETISSL